MFLLGIVLGFFEIITSIILGVFLVRHYLSYRIKATTNLIILDGTILLNGIFYTIIMSVGVENDGLSHWISYWCYIFFIIAGLLTMSSIYLFFEFIEFGMVRTLIFGVYTSGIGAIYALLFVPNQVIIFYSTYFSTWMFFLSNYLRFIIILVGIFVMYRVIRGIYVIYNTSKDTHFKKDFFITFFGISVALIGLFFATGLGLIVGNYNFIIGSTLRGSYSVFISIGFLFTIFGFIKAPYAIYLISQKVFKIIIFKENGITLYEQEFLPTSSKQAVLISGAIHGVSSMIQMALGTEANPKSIKFGDRIILFNFRENTGFALISDRDSRLLRNELNNFSKLFMKEYALQLKNWDGRVKIFKDTSKLIEKAFPFLRV